MFNIDPKGTVTYNGVTVPTILCHQDSYKLKLGSNHSDIYPWFKKHGKTMDDVRNDVATLMNGGTPVPTPTPAAARSIIYKTFDDTKNVWLPDVTNNEDYAGIFGHPVTGIYANLSTGNCVYKVHTNGGKWLPEVKNREDYAGILDKPIDGFMIKGDGKIHYQVHIKGGEWLDYVTGYDETDDNNGYAGILGKTIDGIRMYVEEEKVETPPVTTAPAKKYYRVRTSWLNVNSQKGAYTDLQHAIDCCNEAGEGYKVFDWNGKEVYAAPAKPVQETKPEVIEPKPEEPKVEVEIIEPKPEEPKVEGPKPEVEVTEPKPEEPEVEMIEPKPEVGEKASSIWQWIKELISTVIAMLKGR